MSSSDALPSYYAFDADGKKVQCRLCRNTKFIFPANIAKHEQGQTHQTALERNQSALEAERLEQERLARLYDVDAALALNHDSDDRGTPEPPRLDPERNASARSHASLAVEDFATRFAQQFCLPGEDLTPDDYAARHALAMQELATRVTLDHLSSIEDAEDDATVSLIAKRRTQVQELTAEDKAELQRTVHTDWSPYPSKELFFLDLLDNLPRLRLSDAHLEMIIWVFRQLGCDLPSVKKLRKWQDKLQAACGAPTLRHVSTLGNIFYTNDIRASIAMDFAKPYIAEFINVYPEIGASSVTEVWQAGRWKDFKLADLTPMHVSGMEHFYVDELAQLRDAAWEFAIPLLWFRKGEALLAHCLPCSINDDGLLTVQYTAKQIPAEKFYRSFPSLAASDEVPTFADSAKSARKLMPNPLRALSGGRPLFSVFLNIWGDDVSGNVSKQYNKHNNVCVSNMSLPGRLLQQEAFVHFVSTSPDATTTEILAAVKEQMNATHSQPYVAYHAHLGMECRFRLFPHSTPADNPQQSEECSHMGATAALNCRVCKNRRTLPAAIASDTEHVLPNTWYAQNYSPGEPRTPQQTIDAITEQFRLAALGKKTKLGEKHTETGIKDYVAEYWIAQLLERAAKMKKDDKDRSKESIADELLEWLKAQPGDKVNPLLEWAGFNPHRDTPVELLHTILLGLVRYVWHGFHSPFKGHSDKLDLFAIRLQSTDRLGLQTEAIRASYITQYRGNLIGRHFRILAQAGLFHIKDLCTEDLFTLWKATSLLCPVLWTEKIKDMKQYLADIRILIDNVLAAYAAIDPLRILDKVKLHLLAHIPESIPRFGPQVRYATEIFECFNSIFRMCSVLSNHLAPSRDIAQAMSGLSRMKHYLLGGFWWDPAVKEWRQASRNIQTVILDHPIVQNHIGWAPPKPRHPGRIQRAAVDARTVRRLTADEAQSLHADKTARAARASDTETNTGTDSAPAVPPDPYPIPAADFVTAEWEVAHSVEAQKGDVCPVGAWVVYGDIMGSTRLGRIKDVLASTTTALPNLVVLQPYKTGDQLHPDYGMPVLVRETSAVVVAYDSSIRFIFNAQHDCFASKCDASGTRTLRQEREESERTVPCWTHKPVDRYIINLAVFHNASRLRRVLHRDLWAPKPIWTDRSAALESLGDKARELLVVKAKETQHKSNETREKNKEKARKAAELDDGDGPPEPSTKAKKRARRV